MTTGPKLLSSAQIKLDNTQPILTQNGANQLYFNPVALADFESVVANPAPFVGFEKLSEREVILHHIPALVDGAVRLRRSKTKRTGSCAFGPVLAEFPVLRVDKGWKNQYQYRIDDLDDGTQRFIMLVSKPKVLRVATDKKRAVTTRKTRAERKTATAQ